MSFNASILKFYCIMLNFYCVILFNYMIEFQYRYIEIHLWTSFIIKPGASTFFFLGTESADISMICNIKLYINKI